MLLKRVRNMIACYGAAAAIILEQLGSIPRASVIESPAPQVRVRERHCDSGGWHPDELVTIAGGRQCVLVWEDPAGFGREVPGGSFFNN